MTITNTNLKTGIPYGVISCNSLNGDVWDELYALPNPACDEAYIEAAKDLLREQGEDAPSDREELLERAEEIDPCFADFAYGIEGAEGVIDLPNNQTMHVAISELGGALILYVFESPFVANCRPCSPCIPGAGDLDNLDPHSLFFAYDVPADWRAEN